MVGYSVLFPQIEQPSSCTIQRSCQIEKPVEIHRSSKTGLIREKLMQQSYTTSAGTLVYRLIITIAKIQC